MRASRINNYLFAKNREKLRRRLPILSVAIMVSNDEMPRTADQFFLFRQNSDLFYLSGIEQPKTILCICPDFPNHHYHEILFIERTNEHYQTWIGNKHSKEDAMEISGIKNVFWLDEFENVLNDIMQHARHVYITFHENARTFDEVPLRDARYTEKIRSLYPLHHYERLSPLMAELRQVKEPEEIEMITKAASITHKAFHKIIQVLKPGLMEYEVEAEIIAEFLRNGSTGHAFYPIVASGANACTLHYTDNHSICKDGDLVLVDFGAEYNNYNADVTRTLPVNGKFTARQLEVYNAVLTLLNKATELIKPGKTIDQLNAEMIPFLEEEMIKLNLITRQAIIHQEPEKPEYRKYFMHGVSHYLGLDVHDVGNKNDILVPGMIVTCEPGLYIREEGIGIRLENDILLTEKGNVNLTANIPILPNEIEELLGKG